LEPNCFKIIIEGQTSFSIQGRGLREKIEKTVNGVDKGSKTLDIKGRVRNLKDGRVEILCFGKDVDSLYETIMEWKTDGSGDEIFIKNCTKHEYYDSDICSLIGFQTERSDDQSEMIWALRGAGDRFAESTKELQALTTGLKGIHHDLIERDKKSAIGRLLTLHYELIRNREQLADPSSSRAKMTLDALKSNIEYPAIPEQEFAHLVSQVYFGLQDIGVDDETLKADIDALRGIVDCKLSDFGIKI
jgi:acylphosphatase